MFLKRLAGAVFRHRRDCDGILAELGDSWESRARAAEAPHGGRGRQVENGLELSKRMVARWLMAVKDNLLVIRMDVAGLTQWGSSWRRERVCGRGGIRKNCGNLRKKSKDYGGRQLKVESKSPEEPCRVFGGRELSLFPWRGEDASYRDLLNSDEFERTDVIVSVLQTKCNDLAHTFHKGVETLGLGVTTAKGGNSGDEITFFVLLNQYGEFSFGLHASTLLQEILA